MDRCLPAVTIALFATVASTPAAADQITLSTSASAFSPGFPNQGWWTERSEANSPFNPNFLTGRLNGNDFRSFFTFDLRRVDLTTQTIRQASLVVHSAGQYLARPGFEVLGLFDVTTPAAALNNKTGSNAEIFSDLGTGNTYGTFEVFKYDDSASLTFQLNAVTLRDITANAGSFFSIGGTLLSANDPFTEAIFGSSFAPVSLILKTEALATSPVPEPATMLLLGTGLAGVGFRARRRKEDSPAPGYEA